MEIKFCYLDSLRIFQQTVSDGGFTMINMGNDAEVSYIVHLLSLNMNAQRYEKSCIYGILAPMISFI